MKHRSRHSFLRAVSLGVCMTAASVAIPMATSDAEAAAGSAAEHTATLQTQEVAKRTVRHFVIAARQIERLHAKARKVEADVPQHVLYTQARRIIDATPYVDLKSYRALQAAVRESARVRARVQEAADQLNTELRAESLSSNGRAQ